MWTLALVFGTACIILTPLLIVSSFVLVFRMGRSIAAVNPKLWDEMKPGMYSDIRVSREHRSRLSEFLSSDEYLSLNDPEITRWAVADKVTRNCAVAALCGGAITVFVALKFG